MCVDIACLSRQIALSFSTLTMLLAMGAGQHPLSLPSKARISGGLPCPPGIYMGSVNANSGPYTWETCMLPLNHLPVPSSHLFKE